MERPVNLTPELLQRHAGSLRALAKSLVRDDHAADDVLQDTWVTALERPPRRLERLSGWLASVARTRALKSLRGERRRVEREHGAARPEPVESAEVAAERRQAVRRLTDAVLGLEEPYQTAILLRYFEDLPPRAIAERLQAPTATIKSRLQRGLERLRARLTDEFGGDGKTLARGLAFLTGPLVPIPLPPLRVGETAAPAANALPAASTAGAGVLAMGVKLKIAAAVTGLSLVGAVALNETLPREDASASPAERTAAAPEGRGADVAPVDALTASEGAGGSAGESRRAVGRELSDALEDLSLPLEVGGREYVLEGHVVDADDRPVGGARLFLGPAGHSLNRAVQTDDEGFFRVSWLAQSAAMDLALAVSGDGWSGLRRVRVVQGHNEVRLGLRGGGDRLFLAYDRTLSSGAPVSGQIVAAGDPLVLDVRVIGGTPGWLDDAPEFQSDEGGAGHFAAWRGDDRCPGMSHFQNITFARQAYVQDWEVDVQEFVELELQHRVVATLYNEVLVDVLAQAAPPPATVRGIVRDAGGEPVPRALVVAGRDQTTRADDAGVFELTRLSEGTHALRAGGGDHGLAFSEVTLAAGEETTWEPWLDRGLELTGRLTDVEGTPLFGWLIEVQGAHAADPWFDGTTTDQEGRFAIPNCPNRALRVLVRTAGSWTRTPVRVFDRLYPGGEPFELALEAEDVAQGSVRVSVRTPEDEALTDAEVRLWHLDSNTGVWLTAVPDAEHHLLAGLPAGIYLLEIGSPRLAWTEVGPFTLGPGQELDLGAVALEPPGRAGFLVEAADERAFDECSFELWELRADVRTRLLSVGGMRPAGMTLAAGTYEIVARPEEGEARSYAFPVAAGGKSTVWIQLGRASGPAIGVAPDPAPVVATPEEDSPKPSVGAFFDSELQLDLASLALPTNCGSCHGRAQSFTFETSDRKASIGGIRKVLIDTLDER